MNKIWRCDLKSPCVKYCESENDKHLCGIRIKDKYYKLWLNDTEKYSKEIKKIFLIFGIAYPGLILMGYLLGKII